MTLGQRGTAEGTRHWKHCLKHTPTPQNTCSEPQVQPRLTKHLLCVWHFYCIGASDSCICLLIWHLHWGVPDISNPRCPQQNDGFPPLHAHVFPVLSTSQNGTISLVGPSPGVPLDSSLSRPHIQPISKSSGLYFTSIPEPTSSHLESTHLSFAWRTAVISCWSPCLHLSPPLLILHAATRVVF